MPENTPTGRVLSRFALRKRSCRDGMVLKDPASTSPISLYSKYRYLGKQKGMGNQSN